MPKILVVGDSFMCRDTRPHFQGLHWSELLPSNYDVTVESFPGASNSIISYRLYKALQQDKFDAVVIGFTYPGRLPLVAPNEFNEYVSDCWSHSYEKYEANLIERFKTLLHFPIQTHNDYVIIKDSLCNVAQLGVPFVWSANMWDSKVYSTNELPFQDRKHPVNLHRLQDRAGTEDPIFHALSNNVQQQFATTVVDMLGI